MTQSLHQTESDDEKRKRRRYLLLLLLLLFLLFFMGGYYIWKATSRFPARVDLGAPLTVGRGETFEVRVRISVTEPMNAAELTVRFPAEMIQVEAVRTEGSFFRLWVKDSPEVDREAGTIMLTGGLPSPGFQGSDGLVATLVFTAKHSGRGEVVFDSSQSRVLANDKDSTKIRVRFDALPITVR